MFKSTSPQIGINFFGPYVVPAQLSITTLSTIVDLLCKASDAYAAKQLADQAYNQTQTLNQLGSQAGIKWT